MTKYKNLIFLLLLAALFIEILVIFPNQVEHEDESVVRAAVEQQEKEALQNSGNPTSGAKIPSQKMEGVHLVESQKGNRDWELYAEQAEGSQTGGNWTLQKVKIFFYKDEKVEFTVVGDEGNIDNITKNISVRGNVVTKSTNGYTFKTEAISYNSVIREILSPGRVYVTGPMDQSGAGISVDGTDLRVMVDQSKMQIRKNISARKSMKDGKKIVVAADSVELSGNTSEAKFGGMVRLTYDKMTVEGPSAIFSYSKRNNLLNGIKFEGGVKVSELNRFVTSQNLDLNLIQQIYSFTGGPRLVQDGDELRGNEIIFYDGGKKVKVEKVRAKVENKQE